MENKRWRRWGSLILIMICLCIGARLYYRLTDDFRVANMTYELPFKAPWVVPPLDAEEKRSLEQILDQRFTYIGKGAQCYAFVSEDEEYVLKFFKFKHLKPHWLVDNLPSIPPFKDYKDQCIERKKRKLIGVFNGYELAYRVNKETSALIYLHLVPTDYLNLKVEIVDKIGIERTINLDDVVFLVQKRGETLRTRLHHLLDQGQVEEAKLAMAMILDMYASEYEKGVYDHDHGILHNTGFIGSRPFHLDVGKLHADERIKDVEFNKKDLEHVVWKMDVWIKRSYPHYYPEFASYLSEEYFKRSGDVIDTTSIDPKRFKKKRKIFGI